MIAAKRPHKFRALAASSRAPTESPSLSRALARQSSASAASRWTTLPEIVVRALHGSVTAARSKHFFFWLLPWLLHAARTPFAREPVNSGAPSRVRTTANSTESRQLPQKVRSLAAQAAGSPRHLREGLPPLNRTVSVSSRGQSNKVASRALLERASACRCFHDPARHCLVKRLWPILGSTDSRFP